VERVCHVSAYRRLGACELPDDDHFCALEALLMQLGVKEVALPKTGTDKSGDAGQQDRTFLFGVMYLLLRLHPTSKPAAGLAM